MKILPKSRIGLVEAAIGKREFDLVIKNIKMLNVFTGEIYDAEVGIYDGFIAHIQADPDNVQGKIEPLTGKEIYDGNGQYLVPGFIDTHIHIESTMMTPRNFAMAVVPHGTTTVLTDPHEIANVKGKEAVQYMIECSKDVPMRQYILAPSCVPAVPGLEHSGAELNIDDIEEILTYERVVGIAEVMDFPGVINNSNRMVDIIRAGEKLGGFIQGHAPTLGGRMLSAYLCGGPVSCHESRTAQEAKDKLRLGMYVDARESSISNDLAAIIPAIKDFKYSPNLTLCTDDREPEDIAHEGHLDRGLNRAIQEGMDPIEAIRSVTYKSAKEIGVDNLGAIAPGYVADLVIMPSLSEIRPSTVIYGGKVVAENGKVVVDVPKREFKIESLNTIFLNEPVEETFKIKAPIENGRIRIKVLNYEDKYTIGTNLGEHEVYVRDGYIDLSNEKDLRFVAVLNRHEGKDSYTTAVVRNFGIDKGTVGATVAHDCHNVTLIYSNPKEAVLAVKEIIKMKGGFVIVDGENIVSKLELPICGLMSPLSCDELAVRVLALKKELRNLGLQGLNPALRIATIALPVIPEVRISDMGLIDVYNQRIINMFE